jgi:type 1 fimbria pilin
MMTNLARTAVALALIYSAWPLNANAAQGNVQFWGNITVNNSCVITLVRNGQMAPSTDLRQLSSKLAGGMSGVADITSLRSYDVSVDAPSFFITAPGTGNNGVAFATTFSGTSIYRGVAFAEQPGGQKVRLNNGYSVTRVNVHLAANRPTSFPAGNYAAITTVRCE